MTAQRETSLRERLRRAQEGMRRERVGLVVLPLGSNLRYLSGFSDEPAERLLALLLPADGDPLFLVPALYEEQVRRTSPIQELRVWKDEEGVDGILAKAIADLRAERATIAVDESMGSGFLLLFQRVAPRASYRGVSAILGPLRATKDPEELLAMERASALADEAFARASELRIAGMTELSLARVLEQTMVELGADGAAFETLVASGPNSALPHHRAGARRIEVGDVVILDYGCRVDGYCSDITRTVVCGKATDEVVRVYETVREAQERARGAVRPGVEAEVVDAAARTVIAGAGYGDRFIHRTGHGIGLDVHEPPYIVAGNKGRLSPGMTFSIEPGIYFPGRWGVRIEDLVRVTETGVGVLNKAPHELQEVR
jgi:Xaa-Pro aminopeptidase